jgi:hypothetical protein
MMYGGVEASVPWLPLYSLAASWTGSKRRVREEGAGELSPRDDEHEHDVAEGSARSEGGWEKLRAGNWGGENE